MSEKDKQTGIQYRGQVSVTVKNGNKTISKHVYHNNGGTVLFEYLAACLAGMITQVYCPKKIALFSAYDTDKNLISLEQVKDNIKQGFPYGSDTLPRLTRVSAYSTFVTSGTVKSDSENNGATCTLHFMLPYSVLASRPVIHAIGLFSETDSEEIIIKNKYSAIFLLTEIDPATNEEIWSAIDLSTNENPNVNLIIDWKMSIGNGDITTD